MDYNYNFIYQRMILKNSNSMFYDFFTCYF